VTPHDTGIGDDQQTSSVPGERIHRPQSSHRARAVVANGDGEAVLVESQRQAAGGTGMLDDVGDEFGCHQNRVVGGVVDAPLPAGGAHQRSGPTRGFSIRGQVVAAGDR